MSDYIKREDAINVFDWGMPDADVKCGIAIQNIKDIPSSDVVEVVRCKDCKHRPIDTQEEGNGFDYEFPEEYGCPGYCDDGYYSQRFDDNFFCAWGERTEE